MTPNATHRDRLAFLTPAKALLLVLLSLMLAGVVLLSFQFNYGYDTAQMLHYGRLIGQLHWTPYRDIFEENLPGAILAYTAIGALIDYSNRFLLRLFDLAYLTAISLATWRWLRPLGRQVAWAAVTLFGLVYLLGGPGFSTQREYIFLLPIVAALAVATSARAIPDSRRALIVGVLFGLATTIKPHAAIGIFPVMVYHYFEIRARQDGLRPSLAQIARTVAAYAAGGIIPIAAVVIYLAAAGGLAAWLDIITGYWPLYSTTTGNITVMTGMQRFAFIAGTVITFGGHTAWLISAVVGAGAALWPGVLTGRLRRAVWLMVGLMVAYTLYPAFTGQFYPQHWLPMTYFILALSALCFVRAPQSTRWPLKVAPLVAILVALVLRADLWSGGVDQMVRTLIRHEPVPSIDGDRSAEIAAYLESHLEPGDTVQSLDSVGYAMHGMLLARATPATRFQADAPFYTQPESPYIQALRAEFVGALKSGRPRYIIDVVARVRLRSDGSVPAFPEFERLLREDYSPAYLGHGFLIYERVDGPRPGLVVYPSEYGGMPSEEAVPLKEDLLTFAEGRPAANPAGVERRLAAFAEGHDILLFENLGDNSESGDALETWLTGHAYRVGEGRFASTRLIEYLSPRISCDAPEPVEARFGDLFRVRPAGAALEVGRHRYVCIRLEMEALRAVDRPYRVSAHVVDGAGRSVAQYDSQPQGNLLPTTSWRPGQPVADQFAIRLPGDLPPGDYEIRLYLADAETRQALKTQTGADFAPVGTIHLIE